MKVHVGTSGYNYPEWKGTFYPDKLPAAKMLAYYVERFSTVEINATFYRMPNAKTVAGWATTAPAGFTYVLKAPQRITHFARLRNVDEPLRYFCATDRLGELLSKLPAAFRVAFEFRHESWFDDEVYALLRTRNAALCVADTAEGSTPTVATADFGYLRLRAVEYDDDGLKGWSETIQRVGTSWREAFVFFKHEDSGSGPALARRFLALREGSTQVNVR